MNFFGTFGHQGGFGVSSFTDDRGDGVKVHSRQDYIYKRAYELAASGFHINSITVVTALVQEGYPEAAELLNSRLSRSDLRDVCARHWQGVTPSADAPAVLPSLEPDLAQPKRNANQ